MAFKHGVSEHSAGCRRFTDRNEETLRGAMSGTGLALVEVSMARDVRAGRGGERWLNAVATRTRHDEQR